MVAKIGGQYFSVYDASVEYQIGRSKFEKALPEKQGGFYVYRKVEDAIFAEIIFHNGGLYHAPRTILKCVCWDTNRPIKYGNKVCISNILPVADLGLPMGYKANPQECIKQMLMDKLNRHNHRLEVAFDLGLIKRNNTSKEWHFNNVFENYFSET